MYFAFVSRGVFKTQWNIWDRNFCENIFLPENGFYLLTIFAKIFILFVTLGSDYHSGIYLNFLSRNYKIIFANKSFSRRTFTKFSVSDSKSKSVTKLEVHIYKYDFLPSRKKYCWKTLRDNLLKMLDILIGNVPFVHLITQL